MPGNILDSIASYAGFFDGANADNFDWIGHRGMGRKIFSGVTNQWRSENSERSLAQVIHFSHQVFTLLGDGAN